MLTSFIELEGYKACIYTNGNGPHTCHCFQKRCLLLMDVHITSVIGSRKLRLVFARFILLKAKGEGPDYNLLPREWVQDSLQFNDFQIKFVVKHPRRWSATSCFEIEELAGMSYSMRYFWSTCLWQIFSSGEICTIYKMVCKSPCSIEVGTAIW